MSVKMIARAFDEQSVGGTTKLVLLALADHAHDDGECWPGKRHLLIKTGLKDEATLRRHFRKLEEAGLMLTEKRSREDGSQASNRYRLILPPSPPVSAYPPSRNQPTHEPLVETEGSNEPSNSCGGEVEEVFQHYLSAFPNKRQKKADEGQRKTIRNALQHGSVGELKRCIDACAGSDWHQKRGEYASRKGGKHNSLSLILAPKTRGANYPSGRSQREQIDYWLAREESTGGMSGEERERRIEEWVEARNRYANGEGPDPGATPWEKESTE
ncbi:MAG: helix-turn-helix domain-containing protein [Chthonomonadales bacterium]|nr:helix-turn-helix domain-containing protein [Chthonomonadales bacterium]